MWRLEWDPEKAKSNIKDHEGVTFEEAETVFADPFFFQKTDDKHDERMNYIGMSDRGRLLFVVAIESTGVLRIISARRTTSHERKSYEEK